MENQYCHIEGTVILPDDLTISKARDLATALVSSPYTTLVECRRTTDSQETLIFDAEVELSQIKTADIQSVERLAVTFEVADVTYPDVLALRHDFPKLPHLNLRPNELPRSLCLYEDSYLNVKRTWTAASFVELIRQWLSLSARGKLHADDQWLEPLLPGSTQQLVLPADIFEQQVGSELITIDAAIDSGTGFTTLIANRSAKETSNSKNPRYVATLMYGQPQVHGVINSSPRNLWELHTVLSNADIDLLDELKQRLRGWENDAGFDFLKQARLILVIILPKRRQADEPEEDFDFRAFITESSLHDVGVELGLWQEVDGQLGSGYIIGDDVSKDGREVVIAIANPTLALSQGRASRYSGLTEPTDHKMVIVGGGALGSQVFMILARMGFGQWSMIDDDILLPHNLVRHALTSFFVGHPKAVALAAEVNWMMNDPTLVEAVVDNVLAPTKPDQMNQVLVDADVILDASASISVARHLTHDVDSSARRISIFLNPSGTDVVMLAEDARRSLPLDLLEMQYYRALKQTPALCDHLQIKGGRVRYAQSCRDISSTIPPDLVALHAAICSRAVRKAVDDQEAIISIWQADPDEVSVQKHLVTTYPSIRYTFGDWTLYTDTWLIDCINQARLDKLPRETGGILLGAYDLERKIVYVVDTLPSPLDSVEWPTAYIRGFQGLGHQLGQTQKITAGEIRYVGEWHSHPKGVGCLPSRDDKKAFQWLSETMAIDGLPPLMLIVGDRYKFYLRDIDV